MSELIDRAELFNRLATAQTKADCFAVIQEMPESIVRCKDCVCGEAAQVKGETWCHYFDSIQLNDGFCSYGERREG